MSEYTPSSDLSEQEIKVRKELFRYTDLTHPVMQVLFAYTNTQAADKD